MDLEYSYNMYFDKRYWIYIDTYKFVRRYERVLLRSIALGGIYTNSIRKYA